MPTSTLMRTRPHVARSGWRRINVCLLTTFAFAALPLPLQHAKAEHPWTEPTAFRILARVPPRDIGQRTFDESPTELSIDIAGLLRETHKAEAARIDLNSLRVQQLTPAAPAEDPRRSRLRFAPFRWYDAEIPYEFPEFANTVSRTSGEIRRTLRRRGGCFYPAVGDWKRGRLAWRHRQLANAASLYAIYFDLLPADTHPPAAPPRGWVGDGSPRCAERGASTMGTDHCRVEVDDWNGDGLLDLIVGENYGHVLWWPNRGTPQTPNYPYAKFVMDADGMPIDAGMIAAPKSVDWDGDGVRDLLMGTEWNRIVWYRNRGSDARRELVYQGVLTVDGKPLELPISPLTRGNEAVFKRDYYPVLETCDWDGDGDTDLLAGGYITGRIYFYENHARRRDGTPQLRLSGPLLADGTPLNVGHWCAAPSVADFDGDGDLDLLTGNMPMYLRTAAERADAAPMLQYFENQGSSSEPQLTSQPLPARGSLPRARLATPRSADWDGDGDLDLVVSARENIYLFENMGSADSPEWNVTARPLPCVWGGAPLTVDRFVDTNGDGWLDIVNDYTIRLNQKQAGFWQWGKPASILPPGEHIAHPSGVGDDWFWPLLEDFDQDGRLDALFGDWHGHVWLHRNRSTDNQRRFDLKGVKLQAAGKPIKVGPIGQDPKTNFAALQGARTVLAVADFDRDGKLDLAVGDTYGVVRHYRNVGDRQRPSFAAPQTIGDLGIRLLVDAADWNGDNWPDVVAGAANGRVRIFLNRGAKPGDRFAAGIDPELPPIEQPRTLAIDLNTDGDVDLFVRGTQGSCFVERSFLKAGYAQAEIVALQKRSDESR